MTTKGDGEEMLLEETHTPARGETTMQWTLTDLDLQGECLPSHILALPHLHIENVIRMAAVKAGASAAAEATVSNGKESGRTPKTNIADTVFRLLKVTSSFHPPAWTLTAQEMTITTPTIDSDTEIAKTIPVGNISGTLTMTSRIAILLALRTLLAEIKDVHALGWATAPGPARLAGNRAVHRGEVH